MQRTCDKVQKDFLNSKDKVVVIDDILATGGTISAAFKLIKKTNAQLVGAVVLLELVFLNGRAKLKYEVQSISDVNS